MLTVVYFASLREKLGMESEQVVLSESVATVADLINWLIIERGDQWRAALSDSPVLTAVNQEMCDLDQVVADGDEVAFFPPVTGG